MTTVQVELPDATLRALDELAKAKGKPLGVDHDHASGRIRGLLCTNCNLAIHRLRDDPRLARRAAAYLRRQAAPGLGLPIRESA